MFIIKYVKILKKKYLAGNWFERMDMLSDDRWKNTADCNSKIDLGK